jgi:hypothetical protein
LVDVRVIVAVEVRVDVAVRVLLAVGEVVAVTVKVELGVFDGEAVFVSPSFGSREREGAANAAVSVPAMEVCASMESTGFGPAAGDAARERLQARTASKTAQSEGRRNCRDIGSSRRSETHRHFYYTDSLIGEDFFTWILDRGGRKDGKSLPSTGKFSG